MSENPGVGVAVERIVDGETGRLTGLTLRLETATLCGACVLEAVDAEPASDEDIDPGTITAIETFSAADTETVAAAAADVIAAPEGHGWEYDLGASMRARLTCALVFVSVETEVRLTLHLDCLRRFSGDPVPEVRQNCCMLLAGTDSETARHRLETLVYEEPDSDVRGATREVLQMFDR